MQTLVLDQGYAPVKVISWQRAIQMLFLNKVEIIEEYDEHVHSTFLVIKIPAVVRLLNKFLHRRKPVKFSRVNIYGRDDYKCQYCGVKMRMSELTYDHVIPRSLGGKTTWTNIVTACESCNARKGGRTPAQAHMKLRSQPVQPKNLSVMVFEISRETVPAAWRDYLYWTSSLDED